MIVGNKGLKKFFPVSVLRKDPNPLPPVALVRQDSPEANEYRWFTGRSILNKKDFDPIFTVLFTFEVKQRLTHSAAPNFAL